MSLEYKSICWQCDQDCPPDCNHIKWIKLSDAQVEIDSLWISLKKADNQIDDLEKEVKELRGYLKKINDVAKARDYMGFKFLGWSEWQEIEQKLKQ